MKKQTKQKITIGLTAFARERLRQIAHGMGLSQSSTVETLVRQSTIERDDSDGFYVDVEGAGNGR